MRLVAAAAVALAIVLSLAGCGSSSRSADSITVDLPSYVRASSGTGHVAAADRRLSAHAADTPAANRRPSGQTSSAVVVRATPPPKIVPLTARADAKLNGVSEWIPYWALGEAVSNAIDNADVIKVAHPFIYQISGTSNIVDQSGGEGPAVSQELAAAHIDVIPTVTETDDMGAFAALLTSQPKQAALLKSLESIAEQPANDGIDLDFENLAVGTGNARQIEEVEVLYPELVGKLCAALHRTNRSCEVTVMAKNTPGITDSDGLSTDVYNYRLLAKVADRINIMTYDDHYAGGASGPIAPLPWVQSVLRYALSQIPARKVDLGVPAYGYDWSSGGGEATAVTATSAEQLAAQEHATIEWDSTDEEAYFTYTTATTTLKHVTRYRTEKHTKLETKLVKGKPVTRTVTVVSHVKRVVTEKTVHRANHVVWFENTTANYDRAVLAADDGLAGIVIWAGGDESPGLWAALGKLSR